MTTIVAIATYTMASKEQKIIISGYYIICDCVVPSIMELVSFSVLVMLNVRGLLRLPVIFPQIAVSMAKLHILLSVGILVQVAVVWLVVVGQLPQFDARML